MRIKKQPRKERREEHSRHKEEWYKGLKEGRNLACSRNIKVIKPAEVGAPVYIATALSAIDSGGVIVRGNGSRNVFVLTWSWFEDTRMKTMPVSAPITRYEASW